MDGNGGEAMNKQRRNRNYMLRALAHHERWVLEYTRRADHNRDRRAYREAAHFEDLLCVHQEAAQTFRALLK